CSASPPAASNSWGSIRPPGKTQLPPYAISELRRSKRTFMPLGVSRNSTTVAEGMGSDTLFFLFLTMTRRQEWCNGVTASRDQNDKSRRISDPDGICVQRKRQNGTDSVICRLSAAASTCRK